MAAAGSLDVKKSRGKCQNSMCLGLLSPLVKLLSCLLIWFDKSEVYYAILCLTDQQISYWTVKHKILHVMFLFIIEYNEVRLCTNASMFNLSGQNNFWYSAVYGKCKKISTKGEFFQKKKMSFLFTHSGSKHWWISFFLLNIKQDILKTVGK